MALLRTLSAPGILHAAAYQPEPRRGPTKHVDHTSLLRGSHFGCGSGLRLPTHSPVHSHNRGRPQKALFDPPECNHASFRAHRPDFLDFLCAPFCNFCTLLENDLWYTICAYGATRICAAYVSGFSPYWRFGRHGFKCMRVPLMRMRLKAAVWSSPNLALYPFDSRLSAIVSCILLVTPTFYARFCTLLHASAPFSGKGPVFAQQVEKEIELSKIRRLALRVLLFLQHYQSRPNACLSQLPLEHDGGRIV